jgi:hypothetical protein
MCEACRCCYSRILATDEALDRLQFQLLAIGVVDDFGLGHVRLELRLRDDALELHCEFGLMLYLDDWQVWMEWKCM